MKLGNLLFYFLSISFVLPASYAKCQCGVDYRNHFISSIRPWTVSVELTLESGKKRTCIGTIVASNLIITSHRCVLTLDPYPQNDHYLNPFKEQAQVAELKRIKVISLNQPGKGFSVTQVLADPRFYKENVDNKLSVDIAGLEVGANFRDNDSPDWPICIPDEDKLNLDFVNIINMDGVSEKTNYKVMDGADCQKVLKDKTKAVDGLKCTELGNLSEDKRKALGSGMPFTFHENFKLEEDMFRHYFYGAAIGHYWEDNGPVYTFFADMKFTMERIKSLIQETKPKFCSNQLKPWGFLKGQSKFIKRSMSLDCECGKQQGQEGRVLGGEDTVQSEFPWMTRMYIKFVGKQEKWSVCGASVINDRAILTAAHCFFDQSDYDLHPKTDAEDINVTYPFKLYLHGHLYYQNGSKMIDENQGSRVFFHPAYFDMKRFTGMHGYDVALIILKDRLDLSKKDEHGRYLNSPVCLPQWGKEMDLIGKEMTIIGWGQLNRDTENNRTRPEVLQKGKVTIMKSDDCRSYYEKKHSPTSICGSMGIESGTSWGDSGGPASVKDENGRHIQVGIASHIRVYSDTYQPEFYSNLVELVPFIDYYSNKVGAQYCKN